MLVSQNCRFLLTLKGNGKLALTGMIGKYEDPYQKDVFGQFTNNVNNPPKNIFSPGWAIPKLMLHNGSIIIQELQYGNVPGFEPLETWK